MPLQYDAFDQTIGRTNAILTEHETKHVKARLHARINQVHRIDSHLKNAQGLLTNREMVLEDRAGLVTLIGHYLVAVAPHKRLPTELWQRIFQYVCLGYDQAAPRVANPPILLCRICSSWKYIAENMPELWKSLHFYMEKEYNPSQKLQAARTFFSRAGNLPLSLTLSDTNSNSAIDFVQEVIVPFSRSFRYLHLVLSSSQIKDLLSLPLGSLDSLEELHVVLLIGVTPVSILPAWKPPFTVFSPSSKLRRLRIQLTPIVVPHIFRLPWHCLETFRCDSSIQADDCHELLLSCQALRKLHVRVFGIKYSATPRVEIPLPNLTHFSVHLCDEESYDLFFLPLILPTLQSLMIYNYIGLRWSSGMYDSLVERSGCRVEELYLGTFIAVSQDISRLLERTPTLRSMTLSHTAPLTDELLMRIGRCEVGAALEELFLKNPQPLDPVLSMLEAREGKFALIMESDGTWTSTSPLKFVEKRVHPIDSVAHAARIQRLRDIGIGISLIEIAEDYFQL